MNAADPQPALLYSLGSLSLKNGLSDPNSNLALFAILFLSIGSCVFVSFVILICFRNHFQMMRALLGKFCSRDTVKFSFNGIGHSIICFQDLGRKPATKIS